MTKEELREIAEELCALIPYGVKLNTPYGDYDLVSVDFEGGAEHPCLWGSQGGDMLHTGQDFDIESDHTLPYLRSLESLTDDELEEMKPLLSPEGTAKYYRDGIHGPMTHFGTYVPYEYMERIVRHLRSMKVDVRGLIGRGLAVPAPDGMYWKEAGV